MKTLKRPTVNEIRQQKIDLISGLAKDAFADHSIRVRLNEGMFRSWRCQQVGSWMYGFDIHTAPGSLTVSGDIGFMHFVRQLDMISWARGSIKDRQYLASKVPHDIKTREYDRDIAEAVVREWFESARDPDGICGDNGLNKIAQMEDAGYSESELVGFHCESENEFYLAMIDSGMYDGCDLPDCKNYTSNFLWCVEALKWFLERENGDWQI